MGISGLETFLETHGLAKTLHVSEVVTSFLKSNPGLLKLAVVDGNNLARFLAKEDRMRGGQWLHLHVRLEKFVRQIQYHVGKLAVVFHAIRTVAPKQFDRRRYADDEIAIMETLQKMEMENRHLLPDVLHEVPQTAVYELLPIMLKNISDDVEVVDSYRRADGVAHFAKRNSAVLIIGQNTDFLMYDVDSAYLSLKHLDLDTFTTTHYDRKLLAKFLDVPVDRLPLLATLSASKSGVYPWAELKDLHLNIVRVSARGSRRQRGGLAPYGAPQRPYLAEFLQPLACLCREASGQSGEELAESIHASTGVQLSPRLIQESLDMFRLCEVEVEPGSEGRDEVEPHLAKTVKARSNGGQGTRFLLRLMWGFELTDEPYYQDFVRYFQKELHPKSSMEVFKGLTMAVLSVALPALQLNSVILHDIWSDSDREELTPTGRLADAPAQCLRDLWGADGDSHLRWTTFCRMVDPTWTVDAVRSLERRLVVPVAVLRYLQRYGEQQPPAPLRQSETHALLLTAMSGRLTLDKIDDTPQHGLTVRVVYATNLYMRGVLTVLHALTVCGWPLAAADALPTAYFDGRLYDDILHRLESERAESMAADPAAYARVWHMVTDSQ